MPSDRIRISPGFDKLNLKLLNMIQNEIECLSQPYWSKNSSYCPHIEIHSIKPPSAQNKTSACPSLCEWKWAFENNTVTLCTQVGCQFVCSLPLKSLLHKMMSRKNIYDKNRNCFSSEDEVSFKLSACVVCQTLASSNHCDTVICCPPTPSNSAFRSVDSS